LILLSGFFQFSVSQLLSNGYQAMSLSKEIATMKKILTRALLAAGLLTTMALSASPQPVRAQGAFPAYTSGVQVANLEASEASITLTAYNSDGTPEPNQLTDTIPPNDSQTYFPISNVSNGFQGAIVISSSRRVAAISNILSSDFSAGGSYVGSSQGATTVSLPLLMQNNSGFTTWYSVQNAGTAPANITVKYSDGSADYVDTIPVGAAKVRYQSQETHNAAVFAGTVTSDQPVVAAVLQESTDVIFAYTGFTGGATDPVFPIINAFNSGYITGLQIQNAGDTATEVIVTYTPSLFGTACTETQTIEPKASATFALFAFDSGANSNCVAQTPFVGSAQVTGNSTSQSLVGIGNQLLLGVNGGSYGAFDPAAATNIVVLPLIMDRNSGYFTGFNIQNVGDAATNVNCTFANSTYTVSGNLAPGQALTDIQQNKIADGYFDGATCTGDAGAQLVAIVNELRPNPTTDELLVYEGAASQ
jgi:hypothetical protein